MSEFELRRGRESDHACVYATWLNSYKHGSQFPRKIPDKIYFAEQHDVIQSLLENPGVEFMVATPNGEPDVILGWACFERGVGAGDWALPAVIHYVYVKPPFRRAGIAKALVGDLCWEGLQYSHETFILRLPGVSDKVSQAMFNPYRAIRAAGAT